MPLLRWPLAASGLGMFALVLMLSIAGSGLAQERDSEELANVATAGSTTQAPPGLSAKAIAQGLSQLPGLSELAASLADHDSRQDALLSLIALAYLLELQPQPEPGQEAALVALFQESRAWLDQLAARHKRLPSRSAVLDPAVLVLQQELWQQRMLPTSPVSAMGPAYSDLLPLLFDRDEELIAASFLPEALFLVEHKAGQVWQEATTMAADNTSLAQALVQLSPDWFEPWTAAEPPAPASRKDQPDDLDAHFRSMGVLLDSLTLPEAPDPLRFKRLLFDLHRALPSLEGADLNPARQLLRLTLAVDGVHSGRYLEFSQSLLWIAGDMLDSRAPETEAETEIDTRMAQLLATYLPGLSNHLAPAFSEADARINASLAAVVDIAQELQSGEPIIKRRGALQQELADAIAQLVLMAPDMAFYFDQPVRSQISEEIDICISLMADRDGEGQLELSRQQFDACMANMLDFADKILRTAELSGNPRGPFALDQLARELKLLPAQRINYLLGYLYDQAPSSCPTINPPLPNPLDWSTLAVMMTWFATQAPAFMQTPENESRIHRMLAIGIELMQLTSQRLDCLTGSGAGRSDPVSEVLVEYRAALESLVGGIRKSELEFRAERLRGGADVVLNGGPQQGTSYRVEGLIIGPCDVANSCEMTRPLEANQALIGLFPHAFLLADQTGLGRLDICYDNIAWVDRRGERIHPEEPNVANYFGRLSFELKGRYIEGEESRDIFGATLVSAEEHHYLIAAAKDEVLQDSCPVEWVGTPIATSITDENDSGIVPSRLTYLAASRSSPSELMNAHWSRGEDWRDRFITGRGVSPLVFEGDPGIHERLGQHMLSLYQAEQQAIYGGMLNSSLSADDDEFRMLHTLLNRVTVYKSLLRAVLALFYPESLLDSDELRAMLEGQSGLLDEAIIRRFQADNAAFSDIHEAGLSRLERLQATWKQLPESVLRSGSVPVSLAHAVARLHYVDQLYFKAHDDSQAPAAAGAVTEPEN